MRATTEDDAAKEQRVTSYESFTESSGVAKSIVSSLTNVVNAIRPGAGEAAPLEAKGPSPASPEALRAGLEADFVERGYLWSGQITPGLYDDGCVFTDPTLSFSGLDTFQTNIRNLEPLLDRFVPPAGRGVELYSCVLDADASAVVAEWRMRGDLALPWRPAIDLRGRTRFGYRAQPGGGVGVARYDESWEISALDALLQLLTPNAGRRPPPPDFWPGRLDGAPPPRPDAAATAAALATTANAPVPVVICPGFGNAAVDYVTPLSLPEETGLAAALERRGFAPRVVPGARLDWLRVAGGLLDTDFRRGEGTSDGRAYGWYVARLRATVEAARADAGGGRVLLVAHSAGGWLARAALGARDEGWGAANVCGLVTLGTPHAPPPPGVDDATRGVQPSTDARFPGALLAPDGVAYVSVSSDEIVGDAAAPRGSAQRVAAGSYALVGGGAAAVGAGDGVVPLAAAHLDGADAQLTLDGVVHSINEAGTVMPTDRWYGAEPVLDRWLAPALAEVAAARRRAC